VHDMTAANLRSAYGGESMAHMRYLVWADKADREGLPNVARLFRAVAFSEQVHASNHFTALRSEAGPFLVAAGGGFGLGGTSENLQGAIEGELFEVNEMYPVYVHGAELQEEKGAHRTFGYALSAEEIHAAMYQSAKQAVDAGTDVELGPVQICEVCGYTAVGEAPDTCPLCNVKSDRFRAFA
jgi:rubrerythrin